MGQLRGNILRFWARTDIEMELIREPRFIYRKCKNGMIYVQFYVQNEYGTTAGEYLASLDTHRYLNEINYQDKIYLWKLQKWEDLRAVIRTI